MSLDLSLSAHKIFDVPCPMTDRLINAEGGKCSLSALRSCPIGVRLALKYSGNTPVWLFGAFPCGGAYGKATFRSCLNFSYATEPN